MNPEIHAAVLWGKRQDGYILNSQDRYRCEIHEQDVIDNCRPGRVF